MSAIQSHNSAVSHEEQTPLVSGSASVSEGGEIDSQLSVAETQRELASHSHADADTDLENAERVVSRLPKAELVAWRRRGENSGSDRTTFGLPFRAHLPEDA